MPTGLRVRHVLAAAVVGVAAAAVVAVGVLDATATASAPVEISVVAEPAVPLVRPTVMPVPVSPIGDVAAQAATAAQERAEARERDAAAEVAKAAEQRQAEQDYDDGYPLGGAEGLSREREANQRAASQEYYETSGDAQRAWGCQQGYITQGC